MDLIFCRFVGVLPINELSFQNKQLTAAKVRDPGLKIGPPPSSLLPSSVGSGITVAAAQSSVFGTPIGLRPAAGGATCPLLC